MNFIAKCELGYYPQMHYQSLTRDHYLFSGQILRFDRNRTGLQYGAAVESPKLGSDIRNPEVPQLGQWDVYGD